MKKECVYRQRFQTKRDAKKAIQDYIVHFYNEKRRHSTLDYVSPNQYERINAKKKINLYAHYPLKGLSISGLQFGGCR